jgi:hypothetical protein
MERLFSSRWFVAWTALCCAVTVAFVTWASGADSGGGRLAAILVGVVLGIVLAVSVPVALRPEREPGLPVGSPPPPVPPAPAPTAVAEAPAPHDEPDGVHGELTERLAAGRALRAELAPDADGEPVAAWIASTQALLAPAHPAIARYFGALDAKPWHDEAARLDAHLRRLETILRDFDLRVRAE